MLENARTRRWLVVASWVLAFSPCAPPLAVILNHPPPADAVSLAGQWQRCVEPRCPDGSGQPGTWETITLPGNLSPGGPGPVRGRVQRDFELPEHLLGQELMLTLENAQTSMVRVFFNGHFVGERGPMDHSVLMGDGPIGWTLPSSYVVPGRNVVEMAFTTPEPYRSDVSPPVVLLGPYGSIRQHLVSRQNINHLIKDGALVVFALSLLVVLLLLALEWNMVDKPLFAWTLGLLVFGGMYVLGKTDMNTSVSINSVLVFGGILGIGYCTFEWIHQHYVKHRFTTLRVINRVAAALLVLAAVSNVSDRWGTLYLTWVVPYTLAVTAWCLGLVVWSLWQEWTVTKPLVAMSLVGVAMGAANDLLKDLNIIVSTKIFSVTVINVVFMAVVVIIGEVLHISLRNRQLAQTLSRTNRDLEEALAKANEVNRLKSEFLASTSHELKTPLNSIVNLPAVIKNTFVDVQYARCGQCQALFELADGESLAPDAECEACHATGTFTQEPQRQFTGDVQETLHYLDLMERSGKHLLRLVADILDMGRMERGTMTAHFEAVVVDTLLTDAFNAVNPRAAEKQVQIKVTNRAPGLSITADPTRMLQVLINLLDNATKFSPNGATVELTCERQDAWCTWSVRDQGIGIAPEHHTAIFESFRQVHGGSTRKYGGAGLGLAIVKHLVQLHGGTIDVQSALGQGCQFTVHTPIAGPAPKREDTHEARP